MTTKTPGSSLGTFDPSSLARMSFAALDELFAELHPAKVSELRGSKRGHVLALAGLDWMPLWVRGALRGLPVWRRIWPTLWSGEHFEGEFGSNRFARYLIREAQALDGSGAVIRLDYDVAANPKLRRRLIGELRYLGPGSFLVRMHYMRDGRPVPALYLELGG